MGVFFPLCMVIDTKTCPFRNGLKSFLKVQYFFMHLVHNTQLHLITVCVMSAECVKIISVNPKHENNYVHSRRMSPHCDQLFVFGTVGFPYQYYMYQRLLSQKSHTLHYQYVLHTRITESNGQKQVKTFFTLMQARCVLKRPVYIPYFLKRPAGINIIHGLQVQVLLESWYYSKERIFITTKIQRNIFIAI